MDACGREASASRGEGFSQRAGERSSSLGPFAMDEPQATLSFTPCLELLLHLDQLVQRSGLSETGSARPCARPLSAASPVLPTQSHRFANSAPANRSRVRTTGSSTPMASITSATVASYFPFLLVTRQGNRPALTSPGALDASSPSRSATIRKGMGSANHCDIRFALTRFPPRFRSPRIPRMRRVRLRSSAPSRRPGTCPGCRDDARSHPYVRH